ncbi:hypothetical protein DTO013E5_8433 [Penicillium roqueforti]|uniref:Major facilitator superfamily domain, general substrate transporter n=1 Tax=Penicillium roqueforti (strain FM164) TaxID=1365484 RepID=W6QMI9_PENRF|nr:uncharacterized protein LCP9604111_9575 [Penicillium roqueforti]CDM37181.1 unnamed protein product [Penicillium roqueforti FM164]KAF9238001.1 hypothetical protein LCP9604111_9575 [Penicillium roqueforti]KAI1833423.1 hypothetical protein CBS147337_5921 [Penicillium roqueforti]KAI2671652.1 hypothetical protein LCP963914a_9581 [Penicillium roqueforti]KAI2671785.1 hypothetical protein CBS147355_8428 [Penicillium roqueforti]
MTEVLKGESELQSALADSHTPSSISQLSEKHDSSSEEVEKEGGRTITGFKWILVVTAILSSHMLFALDNTIVANIQPAQHIAIGYRRSFLSDRQIFILMEEMLRRN